VAPQTERAAERPNVQMVWLRASGYVAAALGLVAAPVHVSLDRTQPGPVAGHALTARLSVRPASFRGVVRVTATGTKRIDMRALGRRGSYRARFVFPSAGRWTLSARAGGSTSPLGAVQVRKPAPTPLTFAWPTSIDVEPDGSLLLVENGLARVLRIDARTGASATIADSIANVYAVAHAPSGSIYVSGTRGLFRIDGTGTPVVVAEVDGGAGPLAVAANGDVYFATDARVFELARGAGPPVAVAGQLSAPHGLAVAADGALLVSDTGNDRVLRIDPANGVVATLAQIGAPRGIDLAPDGTIYVVDSQAKRVARLSAAGAALGFIGPVFKDPYDIALARDGALFVIETAASGSVLRVAPDGTVTTLSRRAG
jgi:streptogramin lyase